MSNRTMLTVCLTAGLLVATSACAVGPAYHRPEAPREQAFRESSPAGWTAAAPADGASRGDWWQVFQEPGLDALIARVSIDNQNVLAAEAQYRAAQATVQGARAAYFPVVSATPAATRLTTATGIDQPQYVLPFAVSYQADVWGSIRRTVRGASAQAQASAADLENAKLLYESELAIDYFQLQGIDADRRVLDATVQSFEQYSQLTRDRYEGGVVSQADVALADAQLETARIQLADVSIARAEFEHAIAVLIGQPPTELSVPPATEQTEPPVVAAGLASTLLERRPDVAAAERLVAAANEEIGVAKSAYFPILSLAAGGGLQAATIVDLFTEPTRIWSIGAQLAATIFDGGRRRAQVHLTEAAYDATVANYRQTVLTSFQQVEDALAALRVLSDEAGISVRAVAAAQQSLDLSTTQYRAGLINYLQVITAQTSLLENQRASVDILTRRLVASVSLIQALGGGWDASQLPSAKDVAHGPRSAS